MSDTILYLTGGSQVAITGTTISTGDITAYRSSIEKVKIGVAVTTIGDSAFWACSALTSLTISESVTTIEKDAFSSCVGLTSVFIPSNVSSIARNPFAECNLDSISVDPQNEVFDSRDNCNAIIHKHAGSVWVGCKNTIIPNDSTIAQVNNFAFYSCHSITSVTIPSNIRYIKGHAFSFCNNLKYVTINEGLIGIEESAFLNCSKLQFVTIPSSIMYINSEAFYGCRELKFAKIKAETPPIIGQLLVFIGNDYPIYVPESSVDAYKSAENWSEYSERIKPYESSIEIDHSQFRNDTGVVINDITKPLTAETEEYQDVYIGISATSVCSVELEVDPEFSEVGEYEVLNLINPANRPNVHALHLHFEKFPCAPAINYLSGETSSVKKWNGTGTTTSDYTSDSLVNGQIVCPYNVEYIHVGLQRANWSYSQTKNYYGSSGSDEFKFVYNGSQDCYRFEFSLRDSQSIANVGEVYFVQWSLYDKGLTEGKEYKATFNYKTENGDFIIYDFYLKEQETRIFPFYMNVNACCCCVFRDTDFFITQYCSDIAQRYTATVSSTTSCNISIDGIQDGSKLFNDNDIVTGITTSVVDPYSKVLVGYFIEPDNGAEYRVGLNDSIIISSDNITISPICSTHPSKIKYTMLGYGTDRNKLGLLNTETQEITELPAYNITPQQSNELMYEWKNVDGEIDNDGNINNRMDYLYPKYTKTSSIENLNRVGSGVYGQEIIFAFGLSENELIYEPYAFYVTEQIDEKETVTRILMPYGSAKFMNDSAYSGAGLKTDVAIYGKMTLLYPTNISCLVIKKDTFTVTWKNWDGTTLETDANVSYGTIPSYDGETPTRPDTQEYTYTFTGWSPSVTAITGDTIYTAQFDEQTRKYTVTFNMGGHGTQIPQQQVEYDDYAERPTDPSDSAYTFVDWYSDSEFENQWDFEYNNIYEDITLYARWEEQCYVITFKADDDIYSVSGAYYGNASYVEKTFDNQSHVGKIVLSGSCLNELGSGGNSNTGFQDDDLNEIIVPSTLEELSDASGQHSGLFAYSGLKNADFSHVERIGAWTFEGCEFYALLLDTSTQKIEQYRQNGGCVIVSTNLNYIGESAFGGNDSLVEVEIPYGVTTLYRTFHDCRSLTSVTIPNSVTSIDTEAFECCIGLTSVTIPNSVTSIGVAAFASCSGLTSVAISDNAASISGRAFAGCTNLTSVVIPNSVTSIGAAAFASCSGLTSASIGYSVTSIGNDVFKDCSSLTSVTIPNSVTSIGNDAFSGCTSLTSVTIPYSVASIGSYAFNHCSSLTSITIPNSVTSMGYGAFNRCSGLTSVTIGNSVTIIEEDVFAYCSSLTSITIPNSVRSIEYDAFLGCTSLNYVTIPDSVTSIGSYAFYNCSGLTSIKIGNGVTSIGEGAFYNCGGLAYIKYNGMRSEWNNNVTPGLDPNWRQGSQITYVQCTDGNIYFN